MPIGAGSRLACSAVLLAIGITARSVDAAPPENARVRIYGGPQDVAADPDAIEPEAAPPPVEEPVVPDPVPKPDPHPVVDEPIEPTPPTAVVHVRPGALPVSTTIFPSPWLKRHRLIYRNFLAARVNPLGAVDELTVAYRLQLVMRNTRAFTDSFLLAGAHLYATPAFARVGPTIELQPVAMINLSATYDFVGAFGSFSNVQSFPSATSKWGPDEVLRDIRDRKTYASTGQLLTLSGNFQFLVGKVAIRNNLRAFWAQMKLHRGDRVFYDAATDMLMPNRGWMIVHDADAIYLFDSGLRIAARHTVTHAFYDRSDFRPGEPVSQPNGPTLRVGPAVAYTFWDHPGVRFNSPTIFVLSQWWYRHRFRTGEQRHPAIPYFAIGFSFEGDLFPSRKDTERRRKAARKRKD